MDDICEVIPCNEVESVAGFLVFRADFITIRQSFATKKGYAHDRKS